MTKSVQDSEKDQISVNLLMNHWKSSWGRDGENLRRCFWERSASSARTHCDNPSSCIFFCSSCQSIEFSSQRTIFRFYVPNPRGINWWRTWRAKCWSSRKKIVLATNFHSLPQDIPISGDMKLDDILNGISNLSRAVSQIKNDNMSNSLCIDQIRSSLNVSLKSVVANVHYLIFSLDTINKKN